MKALVIGAGGYVGSRLCDALTRAGCEVHAASSRDGTGIAPRTGLLSPQFAIPAETEVVFYLATSPQHRHGADAASHLFAVNTFSVVQVAELARRAGVRRFLFTSTGNVYAPSFLPLHESSPLRRDDWYALSKVHAEEVLNLFRNDLEVTVVRLFGVYGPGQTSRMVPCLVEAVASGQPVTISPRIDQPHDIEGLRISLCYVDDVVATLLQLGRQGGVDCVNVASEEVVSVREIARTIGELLGTPVRFEISECPRLFDLIADVTRLKELTPRAFVPFRVGIRRTVMAKQGGHSAACDNA